MLMNDEQYGLFVSVTNVRMSAAWGYEKDEWFVTLLSKQQRERACPFIFQVYSMKVHKECRVDRRE